MTTILETKNLQKHFEGVQAIDRLSFVIEKGTITAVIGPNGSGKTTLMNVLSGMLPFDGGSMVIDGVKLNRVRSYEVADYGLTRTFQEGRLFFQMSVLDNILVILTERGIWRALFERHQPRHLKQVEEVLKKVGLWDKRRELAVNLSYGQKKLLEVGRALAMKADIFLFDEPFAGLFPEMVKTIASIMQELRAEGKTIVLIEHNMALIRELTDHVIVMDSGELLAEGKPEEVLKRKDVIEAYLGE